jgi:hypothetical protein|tara:strand:+ start:4996 stop:5469 length:474 start_codon:yes stop_codon:yes gene_type:complete
MSKITIGIDPGKSGGICAYDGKKMRNVQACPSDPRGMANSLREIIRDFDIEGLGKDSVQVIIEHVHAFPSDGRSSVFKFGTNYGMWLGICASYDLDVTTVPPQVWMKKYGELPKEKQERKRYLKMLALSYFQDLKITLKTADAILIAKYGFEELGRD